MKQYIDKIMLVFYITNFLKYHMQIKILWTVCKKLQRATNDAKTSKLLLENLNLID